MFLLEWTASDLLMIALAGIAMIGTVVWIVPSAKIPVRSRYSHEQVIAYDSQIPRYFIAAAVALVIGGAHTLVKNLPGFWHWLWEAGYGGHLFRDLSNSHIIIVGGGTVLLTGLTWYLLPRLANRPLYSNSLASASFWFTVLGVFGFYMAWLVLGLVEGNLVRGGMDYLAAKELLGAAHRVPTRMTASIMGVGYWTYVLNVFLTLGAARHVKVKPYGHLLKFVGVSAAALFVGTVQGVIQVLPANADWIHAAGKFGQFVDPISHAHVNLVTGMMVSLAALLIYFAPRLGGKAIGKRAANRIFWVLVPSSLVFYLTFLLLGLVLGNAVNGYGGIHAPALVPFLSQWMGLLISVSGALMLAGFWVYFLTLWGSLGLRALFHRVRSAAPAAFWLVSSLLLVIGTLQGLLQAFPATSRILTSAEEIPNIHAQLNMIGGVLLALIGVVYLLLPELLGKPADGGIMRRSLIGISGGILGYYLTTLMVGMLRYRQLMAGLTDGESARALGWLPAAGLALSSLPLLYGFASFAAAVVRASREYRASMAQDFRSAPARFSGPMPERLRRIPRSAILGMEVTGALLGWPGAGWLFAGQALPGIALLMIGPSIAWALLPMLFSPFTNTVLSQWNWHVLLVWLPASAALSGMALALHLRRAHRAAAESAPVGSQPVELAAKGGHRPTIGTPSRIPKGFLVGVGLMLLALLSVPILPLIVGVPEGGSPPPAMSQLPERADGGYLQVGNGTQIGLLKLFAWSYPLEEIPAETPVVNPVHVLSIFIQQKGLDDPSAYYLYHLDDGDLVPLRSEVVSFQKQLRLVPVGSLAPGAYMLDIPTGGMFAGRQYYYFRVDSSATTLPAVIGPSGDSEL
jgi:heme/copper-type cytochrome/quinol oxidase subunit 1